MLQTFRHSLPVHMQEEKGGGEGGRREGGGFVKGQAVSLNPLLLLSAPSRGLTLQVRCCRCLAVGGTGGDKRARRLREK